MYYVHTWVVATATGGFVALGAEVPGLQAVSVFS